LTFCHPIYLVGLGVRDLVPLGAASPIMALEGRYRWISALGAATELWWLLCHFNLSSELGVLHFWNIGTPEHD
jgi:hypothetical protein